MIPVIRKRNFHPAYMPNFFENDFNSIINQRRSVPAVNVKEEDKKFAIEMALAGMNKDEIKIEVEKDVLIVSSIKSDEKEESSNGYSRREFGFQSFCRSFSIPENGDIEKISASFKNGILNIDIPKSKEEVKLNREIKIS